MRGTYVMTVDHPMGHMTEVLFSRDGEHFKSLDGLTPSYFEDCGLEVVSKIFYPLDSCVPHNLMAASLAEKIKSLHLYCKYKEELVLLSKYWHLARKLVRDQQSTWGEELKLPEVVIVLANSSYPRAAKEFSAQ